MRKDPLAVFEQRFGSSQPKGPELSDGAKREIANWVMSSPDSSREKFGWWVNQKHPGWNQDATDRAWDEVTRNLGKFTGAKTAGQAVKSARSTGVGKTREREYVADQAGERAVEIDRTRQAATAGVKQSVAKAGTLGIYRPNYTTSWGDKADDYRTSLGKFNVGPVEVNINSELITDVGTLPLQMVGGAGLGKGAVAGLARVPGIGKGVAALGGAAPKAIETLTAYGRKGPAAGLLALGGKAGIGAGKGIVENAIWNTPGGLMHGDWVEQNTDPVNLALAAGLGGLGETAAPAVLKMLSSRAGRTPGAVVDIPALPAPARVEAPMSTPDIDFSDPRVAQAWDMMNYRRQQNGMVALDINNPAHQRMALGNANQRQQYSWSVDNPSYGVDVPQRPELPSSVGRTYDAPRTIPEAQRVGELPPPRTPALPEVGTPLSREQIKGAFEYAAQTSGASLSPDGTVAFFAPTDGGPQVGGFYRLGDGELVRVVGVAKTGNQIAYELPDGQVRKSSGAKWDGSPYYIHIDDWSKERGYLGGNSSEIPNSSSDISDISNMGPGLDDAGGAVPVPAPTRPVSPVLEAGEVLPVQSYTEQPEGGNSQNMSMFSPSETSGGGKSRARLSESERAQELKNRIIDKTSRAGMGVDPTAILDAAELGYYYLRDYADDFTAWSRRMVQDLGVAIEPHIHQIWRALTDGGDPESNLQRIYQDPELITRTPAPASRTATRRVEPGDIPTSPDGGGRVPPETPETSPGGPQTPEELPKYAGNINLNRLETPDEVKREILEAAESIVLEKKWADRTRRISWEETEQAAREMGMTLEDVKKIRPGRPLSEAEVLALRDLHLEYAERVHEAKLNVREAGTPEAKAELIQRMLEYQSVHQALRGVTANAGRTLNIYRKMAAAARAQASGTYRDDAYKKLMEMVGGSEYADTAIRLMMEIPEDDFTALSKFLRGWREFKTGQKLEAYTYANILSGMSTHMTNTLSNIGWSATQMLTRPVAGLFDAARGALQKGYTREHYIRAVPAAVAGQIYGLPTGLRRGLYLMKHGFDIGEARNLDIGNDFEFRGGIKNPWNWPGLALRAADAITSEMARSSQVAYDAMVAAIREGKRGDELNARVRELIDEPTFDMIDRADKFARYSTFTSEPGEWGQKMTSWLSVPIPDNLPLAGLRPLRFVVKFVQVPTNILKAGMRHTPGVGALRLLHPDVRGSGQASEVMAEQVIGGAVMAYGAYLASNGLLTHAAPKNEAARDSFYREGKQPYSIRIGGTWLPYAKLGPLSMPLAFAAGYWSKYDETGELPDSDRLSRAAFTVGKSFVDQSYLSSLADLVDALEDRDNKATKVLANLGSQFVPMSGALRNVEYATDNKVRDAKRYADRGFMEQVGDQIATGIPGLAQRVPARVDTLGRDVERQGRTGVYGFLPAGPSEASQDPVDQELSRLHIYPAFAQKYLSAGGERVDLTRDEYHELQRRMGGDTYQAVYDVVTSDWYLQLDDETRAEVLEQYIGDARSSARELYKYDMGMYGGQ